MEVINAQQTKKSLTAFGGKEIYNNPKRENK